ncbi:MAG: Uma2 family endonuclease [Anaerolineae bacterium]|nr:Uma2 family endonuclease [Anaerolineae bacterium]MDQ7033879.1 Uma2 family endonuclease [Anaerolineae bacterium]
MAIQEKLFTLEDFEAYVDEHPELLVELIDGKIAKKITSEERGVIIATIGSEILAFLKQNRQIKGYVSTGVSHSRPEDKHNERKPDVSFRYADSAASKAVALQQMPTFAIEIRSKTNTYEDLRDKAKFYIANGTKLVWLVYPTKQIVEVYYADGSSDLFKESETLEGGDILPDFHLDVAAIFATNAE